MIEGIKLVRVDFRLIHGQVITKWSRTVNTDRIVVVNDELAVDEFMADVYVMAAPPDIQVDVYAIGEFVERVQAGQFGRGNVLVLFKSIADAKATLDAGLVFPNLQIGGLGSGGGKTSVVRGISIDRQDADQLEAMQSAGSNVTFQVTPEEPQLSLDKAVKKLR
ncbi:PTS sugar transporter subunit IIB [Glycomyces tenuis]|uniref:PTS sugar transporter subunit IIB n=1 Tax=Glycomyces tenuis TaxID=58116 RepID=UPI00041652E3|nr:PTS sugar transporter subunit IIB [Glycomyces tenuis]